MRNKACSSAVTPRFSASLLKTGEEQLSLNTKGVMCHISARGEPQAVGMSCAEPAALAVAGNFEVYAHDAF